MTKIRHFVRAAVRHAYLIVLGLAYAAAAVTLYWRVIVDGGI